jgi:hypothetical protein
MSLPPLPRNEGLEKALGCSVVHYKDAINYGQQCRAEALEEAARLCDGEQWMMSGKKSVDYIVAFNEGCTDCEAVIRRLK